jgi:hypothetical protein
MAIKWAKFCGAERFFSDSSPQNLFFLDKDMTPSRIVIDAKYSNKCLLCFQMYPEFGNFTTRVVFIF